MPNRPPHPCAGCSALTTNKGYCDDCEGRRKKDRESYRPDYSSLYQTSEWKRKSREFLARRPWCVECKHRSTVVDHIKPHRGNLRLFWDQKNWQPMCKPHHDKKTARGQ